MATRIQTGTSDLVLLSEKARKLHGIAPSETLRDPTPEQVEQLHAWWDRSLQTARMLAVVWHVQLHEVRAWATRYGLPPASDAIPTTHTRPIEPHDDGLDADADDDGNGESRRVVDDLPPGVADEVRAEEIAALFGAGARTLTLPGDVGYRIIEQARSTITQVLDQEELAADMWSQTQAEQALRREAERRAVVAHGTNVGDHHGHADRSADPAFALAVYHHDADDNDEKGSDDDMVAARGKRGSYRPRAGRWEGSKWETQVRGEQVSSVEQDEAAMEVPQGFKRCASCGQVRSVLAFRQFARSEDGYASTCRMCKPGKRGPSASSALDEERKAEAVSRATSEDAADWFGGRVADDDQTTLAFSSLNEVIDGAAQAFAERTLPEEDVVTDENEDDISDEDEDDEYPPHDEPEVRASADVDIRDRYRAYIRQEERRIYSGTQQQVAPRRLAEEWSAVVGGSADVLVGNGNGHVHQQQPAYTPALDPHYAIVYALLGHLPESHTWTRDERDRWMEAAEAVIDLVVRCV